MIGTIGTATRGNPGRSEGTVTRGMVRNALPVNNDNSTQLSKICPKCHVRVETSAFAIHMDQCDANSDGQRLSESENESEIEDSSSIAESVPEIRNDRRECPGCKKWFKVSNRTRLIRKHNGCTYIRTAFHDDDASIVSGGSDSLPPPLEEMVAPLIVNEIPVNNGENNDAIQNVAVHVPVDNHIVPMLNDVVNPVNQVANLPAVQPVNAQPVIQGNVNAAAAVAEEEEEDCLKFDHKFKDGDSFLKFYSRLADLAKIAWDNKDFNKFGNYCLALLKNPFLNWKHKKKAKEGDNVVVMHNATEVYKLAKAAVDGNTRKTRNALTPSALCPLNDDTVNNLRSLFPPNNVATTLNNIGNAPKVKVSLEEIQEYVKNKTEVAGGLSGWVYSDINMLVTKGTDNCKWLIQRIIEDISNGITYNEELNKELHRLRGVPIAKPNSIKPRPIGIGEVFSQIPGSIIMKQCLATIKEIIGEYNLGTSISGGIEAYAHTMRLLAEQFPNYVFIQIDIKNAFGAISRAKIEEAARKIPGALAYIAWLYRDPVTMVFTDMTDQPTRGNTASIMVENGVVQGNAASSILYGIAQEPVFQKTDAEFTGVQIGRLGIHDDNSLYGNPAIAFRYLEKLIIAFREDLGLTINPDKIQVYSPSLISGNASPQSRFIIDSCQQMGLPAPTYQGFVVAGIPIGTSQFISDYLDKVKRKVDIQLNRICAAANLPSENTTNGRLQSLLYLIRSTIIPEATYLLRGIAPHLTHTFALEMDQAVLKAVNDILQLDLEGYYKGKLTGVHAGNDAAIKASKGYKWYENVITRIHLPIIKGGLGITCIDSIRTAAYMGSMMLVTQLVKKYCPEFVTFVTNNPNSNVNRSLNLIRESLNLLQQDLRKAKTYPDFVVNDGLKKLEGLTVNNFFNASYTKMQKYFTELRNELESRDLLRRYKVREDEDDKAILSFFVSSADEHTGDWLLPHHGIMYNKLSDSDFILCVKLRIGAMFKSNGELHKRQTGPHKGKCKVPNCDSRITVAAAHAFSDCAATKGDVIYRHDLVKFAVNNCAKDAGSRTIIEPRVRQFFDSKSCVARRVDPGDANASNMRGDVLIQNRDGTGDMMIDVTVVKPQTITPGAIGSNLDTAVKNKEFRYNANFDIKSNATKLKIFGMESSGLFHNQAVDVVKYIARSKANKYPGIPNIYSNTMRYTYQRIAVANQKGNAIILRTYSTHCW